LVKSVALMLDGLDLLDAHVEVAGIFEDAAEKLGSVGKVAGEFSEELEELGIMWNQTHTTSPLG
jgi:hypothetical protein